MRYASSFFVSAFSGCPICKSGVCVCRSAQLKNKAQNILGFWKTTSKTTGRYHGVVGSRSSGFNSTPAAFVSVENATSSQQQTRGDSAVLQQQHTTAADVVNTSRPSSLRRSRQASLRRSPTLLEDTKDEGVSTRSCMDRSVQTSDELLQPLINHHDGLRQRRRLDACPPSGAVRQADSLEDIVGRPWRRHSLSSLSPLSSRLASPLQGDDSLQPPGDLNLDDVLGDLGGVISPTVSLSPLSITEMSSPPRRWRRFDGSRGPTAAGGGAFPLRCYEADDDAGRRVQGSNRRRPPPYQTPNYVVGLPPLEQPQPVRALAVHPPARAPLRRQKPYLDSVKTTHSVVTTSGRLRGVVDLSPASSRSSGAGAAGGRDDSCSKDVGAKSLSALSLEDAINRSMCRLSQHNNTARPNVADDTRRRTDVAKNDVTRPVTSRRPVARPVALSSDV